MNKISDKASKPQLVKNGTGDNAPFPTHGGDLLSASRLSGILPQDIIDFSVSVNPMGIPTCVSTLLGQIANDLEKYPDSESTELKLALARSLGVPDNCITITNGSTELIYFLPSLWKQDSSALCVGPCFSEYERAFRLRGIPFQEWTLAPETAFAIDVGPFLRQLDQWGNLGGIIIGHPNNPTGTLWKIDSLAQLLAYCEKRGIYLVIDETFIEFAGSEHSLAKSAPQSKNLIIVQSLTKFYSLPGLRVGYGITSPEIADKIRLFRPPWSVNTLAQKVGVAVLKDLEFQKASREYNNCERAYLHGELASISSIDVFPSHANFLLFRLRDDCKHTASDLYNNLLLNGILIRNCGNFKGLSTRYFRVAVKKRVENDFLISLLHEHLMPAKG